MKLTILLSSAILFATALTPISAYADDSNLSCNRSANGCDTRPGGGSNKISINGLVVDVGSMDRGNRNSKHDGNRNNRNRTADKNDKAGHNNAAEDHSDADDTDNDVADNTPDTGNVDPGTDNTPDTGNVDPGTDNNDTGASNNSPPQLNSNDIKGFDPFGGLYGPGT